MNTIFRRTSVREFENRAVESEKTELLLRAAMAAPSAGNQQPWEFAVITNKDTLRRLSECSPYAGCLSGAPLGIVLCAKTENLRHPEYAQIDLSAATENLLLEAEELGLGAVWLGIAPITERIDAVRHVIGAPDSVEPFALVAVGYPAKPASHKDRYDQSRIHHEQW